MDVLFTFASEDGLKNYVLYYDPEDEQGDVFVSYYDEEGHLSAVEDEAEWAMIEEVFETFMGDQDELSETETRH